MEQVRFNNSQSPNATISNQKGEDLTIDQLISLMSIYESEFEHRDNVLYSRMFKLNYICLIEISIPILSDFVNISFFNIPNKLFAVFGLICSIVFLFISITHGNRLDKISTTYRKLIKLLPKDYQRLSTLQPSDSKNDKTESEINKTVKRIFNIKLTYLSPILIHGFTILASVFALKYYK